MAKERIKAAVLGQPDPTADAPEWAIDGENQDNLPDVFQPEVAEGEPVQGGPALQNLIGWIGEKLAENNEDSMAGIESIVREYMHADTPTAVLSERLPVSGKDFRDRPILIHGFRLNESDFGEGEGAPAYASMDVTIIATNERKVLNCGGWAILAQLMMLDNFGEWPQRAMIVGKQNKNNRTPLRLVVDKA